MQMIVVGCGRVGSDLAYRLFNRQARVVVIDRWAGAFKLLPPDFRGRTLEGEGLSLDILHRAGIEAADGLAAVTDSDAVNAVIAHVARVEFGVDQVVARNHDPAWRPFHEASRPVGERSGSRNCFIQRRSPLSFRLATAKWRSMNSS
jgi:trk system potassium uptake protein TrkA